MHRNWRDVRAVLFVKRIDVLIYHTVAEMCDEVAANCAGAPERGGILLGALRGPHLEIVGFTTRGAADESASFSFVRQDKIHDETAKAAWRSSGETITFLGDWHTHPYGSPEPSYIDLTSWREQTKRAKLPMVFVIIAPSGWVPYLQVPNLFNRKPFLLHQIEEGIDGRVFSASR